MSKTKSLFPPYLNKGSEDQSKGPGPVYTLQQLLYSLGYDAQKELIIDGSYGGKTAQAVEELQSDLLGFESLDVDGNFGPKTRVALEEQTGIDINAIPQSGLNCSVLYVQTGLEEPILYE